jgi:hypothetical protein
LIILENLSFIEDIEDIKNTKANSTVYFNYNQELINYCKNNNIQYAVILKNIIQLIISANNQATYLLVKKNKKKIKKYQKIVEHYMYDSRLLLVSDNKNHIKFVAKNKIDGIFILSK